MTADHTVAEAGYQERDDCAEAVRAARAEARREAAQMIAAQIVEYRRAGGGLYTPDFIAGLAWANALILDEELA